MTRIADFAASNSLIGYILDTQSRLNDLEVQVSTEKKSQTYAGIAKDSQHLINIENTTTLLSQYINNNNIMDVRLQVTDNAVESMRQGISDFRDILTTFQRTSVKSEDDIANIQDWAFRTLQTLQGYLNTEADGRYMFSGTRVTTQPADLNLSTLTDFQAEYDGAAVTYPTTRDAQLADFSVSKDSTGNTDWLYFNQEIGATGISRITATTAQFANVAPGTKIAIAGTTFNDGTFTVDSVDPGGTWINVKTEMLANEFNQAAATIQTTDGSILDSDTFTDLSFDRTSNTITAATAGSLSGIAVGSAITIDGTADNNGTYTVASNDGTNIVIQPKYLTDEGWLGGEVAGTISATSYYKGDRQTITHRVDSDRSFNYDLTAIDPAFEKAIRAMSIIAQGKYGTEGGLDQNPDRVGDALYLLDSALDATSTGTPPYGTEMTNNISAVQRKVAFNRVLIDQMNTSHQNFIGYLDTEVGRVENIDRLQVVSQLLDDSQALEASYQAMARIRQLSLGDYL